MKLFLTVGSMLPFDRLVRCVDSWIKMHPEVEIFAQIGRTDLRPTNFRSCQMISPPEYRNCILTSDLIVSHVGMGTVITASELDKPLVMLPRRPELKEVTSSHQVETARWLEGRPGIHVAYNDEDVAELIEKGIGSSGTSTISTGTNLLLIQKLQKFISE